MRPIRLPLAILVIAALAIGCGDNLHPCPDAKIFEDATPQEVAWWLPWGAHCDRGSYGAVACKAADQRRGWCVMPDGDYRNAVCMPACEGTQYLCAYGHTAFNDGNECYCVP